MEALNINKSVLSVFYKCKYIVLRNKETSNKVFDMTEVIGVKI